MNHEMYDQIPTILNLGLLKCVRQSLNLCVSVGFQGAKKLSMLQYACENPREGAPANKKDKESSGRLFWCPLQ